MSDVLSAVPKPQAVSFEQMTGNLDRAIRGAPRDGDVLFGPTETAGACWLFGNFAVSLTLRDDGRAELLIEVRGICHARLSEPMTMDGARSLATSLRSLAPSQRSRAASTGARRGRRPRAGRVATGASPLPLAS